MTGYWPAFFLQRKLTRDEGSILGKAFWENDFGREGVLPVYGYLKTNIVMVTNTKDYVKDNFDGKDDYKDNFGYFLALIR